MSESKKKGEELIIQQKVYDMIIYAYPVIEQFPKSQKFSLAQDMKKCLDGIMRLVIAANKKYTKKTTLQELDIEVAALKVYIRMAYELKYLSPKGYETWSRKTVEVGRLVGGWIKAANRLQENVNNVEPEEIVDSGELYQCSECDAQVEEKVRRWSEKTYKKILCYRCQRKYKK